MDDNINVVIKRQSRVKGSLTVADVVKAMNKVNRSKSSARRFLESVGVRFGKNGGIRVRPI
jgi:hypothetical protein